MDKFAGEQDVRPRSMALHDPQRRAPARARSSRRSAQAVWSVNPNLPLASVRTLQEVYDRSLARTSFTLVMLAIAGAMALLLGVAGIYGVISYSVVAADARDRHPHGAGRPRAGSRRDVRPLRVPPRGDRHRLRPGRVGRVHAPDVVAAVRRQPARSGDLCRGVGRPGRGRGRWPAMRRPAARRRSIRWSRCARNRAPVAVLSAKCEVPSGVGSEKWQVVAGSVRSSIVPELAGSHHSALPTSHSTWHFALSTWHCFPSLSAFRRCGSVSPSLRP